MRDQQRYPRAVEEPAHAVDLKPGMTWWQQLLFMAGAAAVSGGSSYVGSHWGGVTKDELAAEMTSLEVKLGKRIDTVKAAVAKDSDDMKAYVDAKTAPHSAPPKKKKQRSDEQ